MLKISPVVLLAGCSGVTQPTGGPITSRETRTAIRRTSDDVTATFRVTDGGAPSEDDAGIRFSSRYTAIITGTVPLWTCGDPTLQSISFDVPQGVLEASIGISFDTDVTPTAECGAGRIDYRLLATAAEGQIETVRVTHLHPDREDEAFQFERTQPREN